MIFSNAFGVNGIKIIRINSNALPRFLSFKSLDRFKFYSFRLGKRNICDH